LPVHLPMHSIYFGIIMIVSLLVLVAAMATALSQT
jgi:hypothetical protein